MGPVPLKISDLILDTKNPRLRSPDGQREAIQQLLQDKKAKLANLAEHIAENGLSPLDRMMVIRAESDASKFIALEGNRRVAALKILVNPSILTGLTITDGDRRKFTTVAAKFRKNTVEPIDAFEVATREEGRPWIKLRHTGANDGRGLISWENIQQSRFDGDYRPAIQAIDFVKEHGGLSEEDINLLDKGFPITTLDRLIGSRSVRDRLGLTVVDGILTANISPSQVIKPLRKIILDLATKAIKVGKLHSTAQQMTYLDEFVETDSADLSEDIEPAPLATFTTRDFKRSKTTRPKRTTADRLTVAPSSLKLNIEDDRVAGIFAELKLARIDKMPNAGAVLIRVFLELSVDHFLSRNNISLEETKKNMRTEPKSLNIKVKEAIAELVRAGAKPRDFLSVTVGIDKASSPLYTGLLNAYVHNRYLTPRGTELRTTWSDAQPFFQAMWK